MRVVAPIVLLVIVGGSAGALAQSRAPADRPHTRQEAWRRLREARVERTTPYEPGRLERVLATLENEQTVENLFEPPSPSTGGYYLTLGNITTGAGLTIGTGYDGRAALGRQVELSVRGALSLRRYWMGEVEAALPRLFGGRGFATVIARRSDYPEEDYYGPGPASRPEDRVSFGHRQTSVDATAGVRVTRWLSLGGGLGFLGPSISPGRDPGYPSIEQRFTEQQTPGIDHQPDFLRPHAFAELDFASPAAYPRTGGRYRVAYSYFSDRELDRYSFERWEIDLRQYVSFLRGRRVLAWRGYGSFSDPRAGHTVPFYLQQWLGGSHSLRGFRDFRLRDRHLLLLQGEYRWELFPALDAVVFYDTGKVAPIRRAINLEDLHRDWGVGFRVGTDERGVLFRVDWALGGGDGQHLMVKFSNAF